MATNAAIVAIVKNELPYLEEWIAHHRAVGFSHFFIADNGSTDGSADYLKRLGESGLVQFISVIPPQGIPPQLLAYQELVKRFGPLADWYAFIDADEFIVPSRSDHLFSEYLDQLSQIKDVGAVALNWALYGSADEEFYRPAPVTQRFFRRGKQNFPTNLHYKSVVKAEAYLGTRGAPHHFTLREGYRYIAVDGSELEIHPDLGEGMSSSTRWEPFRINHYALKSKQEFFEWKRLRGRATSARKRGEAYFARHDANGVVEKFNSTGLKKIRAESLVLRRMAGEDSAPDFSALFAPRTGEEKALRHLEVDTVQIRGSNLVIRGWAIGIDGKPFRDFIIEAGQAAVGYVLTEVERPDVKREVEGAALECGYEISIPLLEDGIVVMDPPQIEIFDSAGTHLRSLDVSHFLAGNLAPSAPASPAALTVASLAALKGAMTSTHCYLEYGAGESTIIANRLVPGAVFSVDSDIHRLSMLKRKMLVQGLKPDLHLIHADIGNDKDNQDNANPAGRGGVDYVTRVWREVEAQELSPDLVFIAGQFRKACFLATLAFARPGTRVFFDNYKYNADYQAIGKVLCPVRTIGRMAEFLVPEKKIISTSILLDLMEATEDAR